MPYRGNSDAGLMELERGIDEVRDLLTLRFCHKIGSYEHIKILLQEVFPHDWSILCSRRALFGRSEWSLESETRQPSPDWAA